MYKSYKVSLLALLAVLSANFLWSQCFNANFANGDFSGWTPLTGTYTQSSGNLNLAASGVTANRHTIITAQGTDPQTGNNLQLIPPGYNAVARISGSNVSGGASSGLSYTMNVTAQNALFIYNYAVVLQDPGHSNSQQPRFELSVRDHNGNLVPCTFYDIRASGSMPGWNSQGSIRWRNWTKVGIDLSSQIGNNVTITAGVAGCVREQGAHWGYAYLVAECRPMEIDIKYCLGDAVAQLEAPPGFESYIWNPGGATTQSITIPDPASVSVNYTVDLVSNGGQCHSRLTAVLNPSYISADFSPSLSCGNSVAFTDMTIPTNDTINTWFWDFGDGNTLGPGNSPVLAYQNPVHTYDNPGTYTVTMIPTSGAGCSDTIQHTVSVYPSPNAAITFQGNNQSLTNPDVFCDPVVSFSGTASHAPPYDATIPIVGVEWNFGEPGATSTQYSDQHTYLTDGTHTVTFIATDSRGCTDTVVQDITIHVPPVADFDGPGVCQGDSTLFTNTSVSTSAPVGTSLWTFENQDTSWANTTTSYLYPGPGSYEVTLAVMSTSGCVDTITKEIQIYHLPSADFVPSNVCTGVPFVISNTSSIPEGSITSYSWDFGTPSIPASNAQEPQISYDTSGTYSVTLVTTSNQGCTDTISRQITVLQRAALDYIGDVAVCGNRALLAGEALINGQPVPGAMYAWVENNTIVGHGQTYSHQFSVTPTGTAQGTLVVNANGCIDSLDFQVVLRANPIADFNDEVYCAGAPQYLESNASWDGVPGTGDVFEYYWLLGDGQTSNLENVHHVYPSQGEYDVTLVVTSPILGCSDTITKTLKLSFKPDASFTAAEQCFQNVMVTSTSTVPAGVDINNYIWSFGDGTQSSGSQDSTKQYEYQVHGNYTIELVVQTGEGCSDTAWVDVIVKESPKLSTLDLPNIITANGDGINDELVIPGVDGCIDYELFVYNRWGNLVYKQNSGTSPFKGHSLTGSALSAGVYFYVLKSGEIRRNGTVTIAY